MIQQVAEVGTITDIGPIEHTEFPILPDGGVVLYRGANGSGKSHALAAMARLGGNKKIKLPVRDNAIKGEISGHGVCITIGNRVGEHGQLEVLSIDGKWDLTKLVDGGHLQDPAASDRIRIKELLKLLEIPFDESMFHELAGGPEAYEKLAIKPSDDVVELAERVKRAMDSQARDIEAKADRLLGQHQTRAADTNEFEGVERDAAKLQAALETAIKHKATLDNQFTVVAKDKHRREEAKAKLDALPESNLPSLEQKAASIKDNRAAVAKLIDDLEAEKEAIIKKIAEQDAIFAGIDKDYGAAVAAVEAERQRCHDRTAFEAILSGDPMTGPSISELADAEQAVEAAREAADLGTRARVADEHAAEAAKLKKEEIDCRKEAERIREAGRSTDQVLSDLVGQLGLDLKISEGRLCMPTGRGLEPFSELSHGQRWKTTIQLAQLRVGKGGMVHIPQEGWEGLQPKVKREVLQAAIDYGVTIYSAEADDGELRAEVFDPDAETLNQAG